MVSKILRLLDRLHIDWYIFVPGLIISLLGLITMNSFEGDNYFFYRQSIWILISTIVFLIACSIDWRFLRRTSVLMPIFGFVVLLLSALFVMAEVTKGAQSWFRLGFAAFQPVDLAKLVLILILAKYFSRRHVEIKNLRHIIVSGVYALILFALVFLQPDFGGAMVLFALWFGMILVSGLSKKHLMYVALMGAVISTVLWSFVFAPYQKARILTFINPMADIRGTGYNAYQSTIAVGSGQFLGKGVGQGSQSKLQFLPEYETDFIFAAYVEEWGFVGAMILLILVLVLLLRIINNAKVSATNFETLFALGVAVLFIIHITIHAGMNMGVMPVTGLTFPLMSYGGSHLLIEWLALGMISSMRRHTSRPNLI